MSKVKFSIGALFIAAILVLAWVFIPTHVRLSSEILNKPVGEGFKLVGYKAISTKPQDGKLNHYFLIDADASAKDATPFLISSDPFIKFEQTDETKLSVTINGRVKQLDNDLWVERSDGTVQHWLISANINYVR